MDGELASRVRHLCFNLAQVRDVINSNNRTKKIDIRIFSKIKNQRWSRRHEARGQGQGQGHKKKIRGEGQGQPYRGQALPRPKTEMLEAKDQGQVLSKKNFFEAISKKKQKNRSSENFAGDLQKKPFSKKFFQALHKLLTAQKIVPSSSWGQGNFRGLEAKNFKMCPRGQGRPRGLHLC